jgi:hypothetical protein
LQDPVTHEENSCCFLSNTTNNSRQEEQNVDYVFEQIFKKSTPQEGMYDF